MSRVTIRTSVLRDNLSAAASVRNPRDNREALRLVLLRVSGRDLTFGATNGEMFVRLTAELESDAAAAECLVAPERLLVILREASQGECELEFGSSSLSLRCGGSRLSLQTADASGFPPLPSWEPEEHFTCQTTDLQLAISRTEFATDPKSTRYSLGAISFDCLGGELSVVGCDGRRISACRVTTIAMQGDTPKRLTEKWTVDGRHAKVVSRLLTGETVDFAFVGGAAMFRSGGCVASVQMTSGTFVDWRSKIPNSAKCTASTVCAPLLSLLRQSQVLTSEKSRGTLLSISPDGISASGKAADIGSGDFRLPAQHGGEPMATMPDAEYLIQWLAVIPKEGLVEISLVDSNAPILLSCGNSRYLLQPLVMGDE